MDGAFWHGHPSKYTPGKSGEFWDRKIGRNVERDRLVGQELEEAGWTVLRFWDFEIAQDPLAVAKQVAGSIVKNRSR